MKNHYEIRIERPGEFPSAPSYELVAPIDQTHAGAVSTYNTLRASEVAPGAQITLYAPDGRRLREGRATRRPGEGPDGIEELASSIGWSASYAFHNID